MDTDMNSDIKNGIPLIITRKKRVDKPFRKTKYIDQLLNNNPNISTEEIAEFRKIYRQKLGNIRSFCKKHPDFDQQVLIDALPLGSVEDLKNFKIIKWLKSQGVIIKTETSDRDSEESTDNSE